MPELDDDCDCKPDAGDDRILYLYTRTCPMCGFVIESSHCPHDGVQNPCRSCGWIAPGKRTPFQFLGVTEAPQEAVDQ